VRIIIASIDETKYLLAADDLPELSEGVLMASMADDGYPVADVRKVLHEGRGRLLVEFYLPVSIDEAKKATKSGVMAGDTPLPHHYYKLTKMLVMRTSVNEPIDLPPGSVLRHDGDLPTQTQFHVTNGRAKDVSVRMSPAEWMMNATSLVDMGDDLGQVGGMKGPIVPNEFAPVTVDGLPNGDPAPGLTPKKKKTKKKGFPDWPARKPLKSYMTKKK